MWYQLITLKPYSGVYPHHFWSPSAGIVLKYLYSCLAFTLNYKLFFFGLWLSIYENGMVKVVQWLALLGSQEEVPHFEF